MKSTPFARIVLLTFSGLLFATTTYAQQFGIVSGRVLDADSKPAFQMEVRAAKAETVVADSAAIFAKDRIFSYVDQNGSYRLNYLPAGRYILVANADFRRPYTVTYHPGVTDLAYAAVVTVVAGQEVPNINISLDRPSLMLRAIEGVCVWEDGRPAVDTRINLLVAKYPWGAPDSTGTDKNGAFTLHGYEGIEYLVDLPDYSDGKKPRLDPVKVSPKAGVNRVRLVLYAASQGDEPLIKETIYLKYVKMCVCCEDGDRDLLPLAMHLLSKRGEIEVDVRDNTLTVTDERRNIEAVHQLVECYENPESSPTERKKRC